MTPKSHSILYDIAPEFCRCMPWQQSWKADKPGWCASCDLPFNDVKSKAREVCLKTEGCLLLPDHEGECDA